MWWEQGKAGFTGIASDGGFPVTLAAPLDPAANLREGQFDEFAHRASLAGGQHKIVGRISLQYPMHALDIIPGVAPVAFRPEVSEIECIFQTRLDAGDAAGNLARHESLAADRAF